LLSQVVHRRLDLTPSHGRSRRSATVISGTFTLLLFSLIGCGGNSDSEDDSMTQAQTSTGTTLTYSGSTLTESEANDGSFESAITVTLARDSFSRDSGLLEESVHYKLTGPSIPAGLRLEIALTSGNGATLSLVGNAISHALTESISGVRVSFLPAAFGKGEIPVNGSQNAFLSIDFIGSLVLFSAGEYRGNFSSRSVLDTTCQTERPTSVRPPEIRALISIDSFDEIRDMPITYNIPMNHDVRSSSQIKIAENWEDLLDGTVVVSLEASGVTSGSSSWWSGSDGTGARSGQECINWTSATPGDLGTVGDTQTTNSWMTGATSGCDQTHHLICVAFQPSSSLSFSKNFFWEAAANNGSIAHDLDVTLERNQFASSSGTMIEGLDYSLSGTPIPAGLSLSIVRDSDTTARMVMSGNAAVHAVGNSVSGIVVTFLKPAFKNNVEPANGSNIFSFSIRYNVAFIYQATLANGELGGRVGADGICDTKKPNEMLGFNIRAFLSVTAFDEIRDMSANYGVPTANLFLSLEGIQIGNNFADLLDGSIDQSLNESNVISTGTTDWWSGSTQIGSISNTCGGWTSVLNNGTTGDATQTNGWLSEADAPCAAARPLLCVAFP